MAAIKEKDLPQVGSLSGSDYVRAVSSSGVSEIVPFNVVKGVTDVTVDGSSVVSGGVAAVPGYMVDSKTTGSFDIAANNAVETSIDVSKTGYTPVCVVGYNPLGSGVSYLIPYHIYLSGSSVYYAFRNNNNTQRTGITITFYILYRENS